MTRLYFVIVLARLFNVVSEKPMCTSLIVGKNATVTNVTLIARNEDCQRSNWNKSLVFRHQPEYVLNKKTAVKGDLWTLGNGLTVNVPTNAFCYSAMPDACSYEEASSTVGDRFFFEERGINQHNVAISATNSMHYNPQAKAVDPLLETGGIAESIIPTLLLPQMLSAVHGVELLGSYVSAYGASEANGILFSDCDESWYFEIGSGHQWIAVRVPQDQYLVVTNSLRVHGVNLNDHDNVRCSDGLFDFVIEHGLLEEPDSEHFDFAKAFGDLGNPYNVNRLWLAQKLLSPSQEQPTGLSQYPLFMTPDTPIAVNDVMTLLRATYAGTVLEGKADRTIGWLKTAESHIITLDADMPDPLRGVIWQAVSTTLCTPYIPLWSSMREIPDVYTLGSNQYGTQSAYWAFRGLYALAKDHGTNALTEAQTFWREYTASLINEHSFVRDTIAAMYRHSPETATTFAGRYSYGVAQHAVSKAHEARNRLMTAITIEDDKPGNGL